MKIEIYEENSKPEKTLRLRLIQRLGDSGVDVVAVDKDGNKLRASLLIGISSDGMLRRYHSVNNSLGLSLDKNGRIKIINE